MGHYNTCCFVSFVLCPPFVSNRNSVPPPAERRPGAGGGTDVGRLALGSGTELTNANYCAKLLAKYVSPRRIRLLRGRFMVRRNSVFLKGGRLKTNGFRLMDMALQCNFFMRLFAGYHHCLAIWRNELFL